MNSIIFIKKNEIFNLHNLNIMTKLSFQYLIFSLSYFLIKSNKKVFISLFLFLSIFSSFEYIKFKYFYPYFHFIHFLFRLIFNPPYLTSSKQNLRLSLKVTISICSSSVYLIKSHLLPFQCGADYIQ